MTVTSQSEVLVTTTADAPSELPPDLYPLPTPAVPGVVLNLSAGCPNVVGIENADQIPADAILDVLRGLGSGQIDTMRRVSDRSFWPLLEPDAWRGTIWPPDALDAHPAVDSPYADLLTNGCGRQIVEDAWWVRLCPGPCQDAEVARAASLTGHIYLIRRSGHWLIWAAN